MSCSSAIPERSAHVMRFFSTILLVTLIRCTTLFAGNHQNPVLASSGSSVDTPHWGGSINCGSCHVPHNSDGGGSPLPTEGYFYSMHDVHTWGANGPWGPATPQYDSDHDGTADSRITCLACHNVHGSPSPAMIRHGELIGSVPSFDFKYLPEGSSRASSTGGQYRFIGGGAER